MRQVLCAIALTIPVVIFTQAPADSVSPPAKQLHDRAVVVEAMMKGDLPKVMWEIPRQTSRKSSAAIFCG